MIDVRHGRKYASVFYRRAMQYIIRKIEKSMACLATCLAAAN